MTVAAREDSRLALDGSGFSIDAPPLRVEPGAPLLLGIRPRDVSLVAPGHGDAAAQINLIEPLGHETVVRVRIDAGGPDVTIVANADEAPASAQAVGLRFRRERLHLSRADDGRRIS